MARSILLMVCLAFFVFSFVGCVTWGDIAEQLDTNIDVKLVQNKSQTAVKIPSIVEINVKNITTAKDVNATIQNKTNEKVEIPKYVAFQPRAATPTAKTATITYKLGKRVAGDRLVASNSQSQQWTVAQNVTQNLSYPKTGVGAIITYVEVIVDQSVNLGRAFVTSGGIGQRQIAITIEAQKTLFYRQNAQIYGY